MYKCVLKNKEGLIFDEGQDFQTLKEAFKWASNRPLGDNPELGSGFLMCFGMW